MTPQLKMPIRFIPHTVENYRDRLRPGLSIKHAEIDLERVAAHAEISWRPPDWLKDNGREDVTMFLTVADATFPLTPSSNGKFLVALTCMVKGSISPQTRKRRNLRRRRG